MDDEHKPRPFLRTPFNETDGRFSPDGRWIAYVSDESGRFEVYVRSFVESGEAVRHQISTAGGLSPRWRRDGRELFFVASDQKMMAVPVRTGASFEAGAPVALFRTGTVVVSGPRATADYDVSADGQRFLITRSIVAENLLPLTAVVNWTQDLKR